MKWILIWLLFAYVNAPWWLWMSGYVCMLIDASIYMWRVENGK